jgi:response regulator RpfG family c-di-GMP phosphodiesterase
MRRLEFAAYLRDIGLAAVPYRIINNLEQLTEAERFTFIRHAEAGAAMLENIVYLRELAPIVRYHHDFWNGDGILPRAKSARLPKEAAVIAAVTQYSFWKTAYGHDMALEMVRKGSGTQFNPETTRALSIILETHHEPNYWDMLRQSVAVFLT